MQVHHQRTSVSIRLESKLDTTTAGVGLFNKWNTADCVTECSMMKLFCLYSFSPPDLNSRIKSRLSVRPSSKYNRPVHSVTCTCQKCGMSQKQRAQRRVKESQRDVKRTDWDEGKRYANMRMTSSLREEKKEGWEWGEARAKSRMKQKWAEMENHSFVKQKKKQNYITYLEKTI